MTWTVAKADRLDYLHSLPADSVDLIFGSPPYEKARTYGIDFRIAGPAWVDWMVQTYLASQRVCRGLVAFVVEGQTQNFRWSATPALLMADLHRAGLCLRKPPVFHRVGIAGSGGPDWLRNDYEFIVCTSRPGRLPWSDNTAMGHAPKWAPGGTMSHRHQDGRRKNATNKPAAIARRKNQWGMNGAVGGGPKNGGGKLKTEDSRPSHNVERKTGPCGTHNGDLKIADYKPPVLANPGNKIQQTYTTEEVAALLEEQGDFIKCKVGGGVMGDKLCHENEAPFPELLAEWFIRSFCPPGGMVVDPFCGSGTTGAVAIRHGRNFSGCDVRQSQVELARRRIAGEEAKLRESIA